MKQLFSILLLLISIVNSIDISRGLRNRKSNPAQLCLNAKTVSGPAEGKACGSNEPGMYIDVLSRIITNNQNCLETTGVLGSSLSFASCSSNNRQIWDFDSQERLVSRANKSLCLDMSGPFVNSSASVTVEICSSSTSQQWFKITCPDRFQYSSSGVCICDTKSYKNGTNCLPCPQGFYSNMNRDQCLPCPSGECLKQYGVITLAGSGIGNLILDGQGTMANLDQVQGMFYDESDSTLYFAEIRMNLIRKMNSTGYVETVGGGTHCRPADIIKSVNNSLLFTDGNWGCGGGRVRRISSTGQVTTVLGVNSQAVSFDGSFADARIYAPLGLAVDSTGLIYVAESQGDKIRILDENLQYLSTLSNPSPSGVSITQGPVANFSFNGISDLTVDTQNNLYGTHSNVITKISLTTKMAFQLAGVSSAWLNDGWGTNARFYTVSGIVYDKVCNCLYASDTANGRIRRITLDGFVETISHDVTNPSGIVTDQNGNIFVVDTYEKVIKKIIPCPVNAYWDKIDLSCKCNPMFELNVTSNTCFRCPNNTYYSNFKCLKCPLGSIVNSSQSGCDQCLIGKKYRPFDHLDNCIDCPLNSICVPSNAQCLPGYASNFTSTGLVCQQCPLGHVKADSGNISCTKCSIGMESNQNRTMCQACPISMFKPSESTEMCTDCPVGAKCSTFNMTCLAGHSRSSNQSFTCNRCIDGYYKVEEGDQECTACPQGLYSSDDFTSCFKCPAGSVINVNGTCDKCKIGEQPNSIRTECIPCPTGTYKSTIESPLCLKCPRGAACDAISFICLAGYEISVLALSCNQCPTGYYKDKNGNAEMCKPCNSGTESNAQRTGCNTCPDGKFRKPDSNVPFCLSCPENSICRSDGFTCKPGFELLSGADICNPIIEVIDGKTQTALFTTLSSDSPSNTNPINGQMNWNMIFQNPVTYAIIIPILILCGIIGIILAKFCQWRQKDKERFGDYKNKSRSDKTTDIFTISQHTLTSTDIVESSNEYAQDVIAVP